MYANKPTAKDITVKAALSGIGLWGLSAAVFGDSGTVNVMGNQVNSIIPIGLAGAGASVASDLGTSYLLPMLPQDDKMKNANTALADTLISGVAGAAILKGITNIPNNRLFTAFALSAAINDTVEYLYFNIIDKKQGGFLV